MSAARSTLIWLGLETAAGLFHAGYSAKGLAELHFPAPQKPPAQEATREIPTAIRHWHQATTAALKRTLAGRAAADLPPLDWSAGTEFQQQVWAAMLRIPPGKTLSYGEIAQAIGRPKAVRAVGGACGANPIPVLVPCHRVLAAGRRIGGFSSGLDWKRKLLAAEGVLLIG